MEDQSACANTSRRSGLRATKRIDYSTLEGGTLDEEEPPKKVTKEGVSPELKTKKVTAKKRRLSAELSSPPSMKDDDGDWDDDGRPKRTSGAPFNKKLNTSAQDLEWKGIIFFLLCLSLFLLTFLAFFRLPHSPVIPLVLLCPSLCLPSLTSHIIPSRTALHHTSHPHNYTSHTSLNQLYHFSLSRHTTFQCWYHYFPAP